MNVSSSTNSKLFKDASMKSALRSRKSSGSSTQRPRNYKFIPYESHDDPDIDIVNLETRDLSDEINIINKYQVKP